MSPELENLLKIIEQKLDWGSSETWQSRDFETLNQQILDKTGVSLSASTLRRVWGRVEYNHLPSATTLDALARFGGFESWRMFTKAPAQKEVVKTETPEQPTTIAPVVAKKAHLKKYWVAAVSLLVLVITGAIISTLAFKSSERPIDAGNYTFTSKQLTRGLPNSVVFTYDAGASPVDSVFIQQSWDPNTKTLVEKNLHQHTAVYYTPGYYDAKLLIGDKIVQQHRLLIPTDGWLGIIDNMPVPVYLKRDEYIQKDSIYCPIKNIQQKNVALQPKAPIVRFYNVGNFDSVDVKDFNFSADVKNEFNDGSAACQLTGIYLVTDYNPIFIQLGIKGCAGELNLGSMDKMVSGKKADLSGFGVDFSQWATVNCKSSGNNIQYFVNGKLAYQCPLPARQVHIVGVQFAFEGTGAVKNITLTGGGKQVFKAF